MWQEVTKQSYGLVTGTTERSEGVKVDPSGCLAKWPERPNHNEGVQVMSSNETLAERLKRGRQLNRAKHLEAEKVKVQGGFLRAGNSGIMSSDGDIAASCHRKAHLRSLGIEVEPPTDSRLLMFQLGILSEDGVLGDLVPALEPGQLVLREEEIAISWTTSNTGTQVSGRPDLAVCTGSKEAPTPVYGMELKSIASLWTSRDILGEGEPKIEHLTQAAHYSWQLGLMTESKKPLPYYLVYRQYGNQYIGASPASSWIRKMFPKQGEAGSEWGEYDEKGVLKQLGPFEIVFELGWNSEGYLRFRLDQAGSSWTKTLITIPDIKRYYEFLADMSTSKDLGPRPLTISAQGKEKNWSLCGYCPLNAVCDKQEVAQWSYEKWLTEVRKTPGIHILE